MSGDFNSSAGGADSRNGGGRCSAEKKCGCFRPENQDERLALAGIECLENFIREAGLPASLRELGFSEEDREKLGEIAESCFISQGAFRPLTTAEIKEIYEECW